MKRQTLIRISFAVTIFLPGVSFPPQEIVNVQPIQKNMNKEFKKAETPADYKRFIQKYKPDELAFVAVQRLVKPYLIKKDWLRSITIFQKYKDHFPGMEERFDKIINLLAAPEQDLAVKNLGPNINTENNEHSPIISADGKRLYYCSSGRNNGLGNEDIYLSILDGEQWKKAINLGIPICTASYEAPQGISADGNLISLFGNYDGSLGHGDNFYAEKTATGWSEVKHYPAPINSTSFDADAMLSADGKAIFFISERPGGIGEFHERGRFFHGKYWGNIDIYVCIKTGSGWSKAINLGGTVNTSYCEYTPFLHPDGKTLYFSSDGHYGLGNLDVFKSTRLNDTSWTEWSDPINLGKEINGPENDWGYRITTSGNLAYFSAYNKPEGYGKGDIYSIEIPHEAKPMAVVTVSGIVIDHDGNPLETKIRWNDLTMKKEIGEARTDPQTGKYFIALPAGHEYSYHAEKEDYIGKSEHLDLTGVEKKEFTEYTLDIILYPIEQVIRGDVVIELKNIFFEVDKWQLSDNSTMELDRWVDFLMKYPVITMLIYGHTDNTGIAAYNKFLSEKRAQAVMDYFIEKKIERFRITAKGFGESRPVATNKTREGRRKNRRVEVRFGEMTDK